MSAEQICPTPQPSQLPLLLLTAALVALTVAISVSTWVYTRTVHARPAQRVNGQGKRSLPRKIILVRHAESLGNVEPKAYATIPDSEIPLTEHGKEQARQAGEAIRKLLLEAGQPFKVFCIHSPYRRTIETSDKLRKAFDADEILGVQEEVQLREQDFGNFQHPEQKELEKRDRLRFGRFFYRFPNGESGADVYDRVTIFEDHLVRDINAGRFPSETILVLITHGLALRIFLMRWFHWTVAQALEIWNPQNCKPIVLDCISETCDDSPHLQASILTKAMYRMTDESRKAIKGCTEQMCSSTRYWPQAAQFAFNSSVGARSLARPLIKVPSKIAFAADAAHQASPVHSVEALSSIPGARSHGGSMGMSLLAQGADHEDSAIHGFRTAYVS